ncbi:cyclic nucleotide-gated channel rod photoreceptor subunit alpha-like isoform X2 [Ruditapes philippinarum]|uniref:cyclic nucleotide-gated channel rod photoreceptor subunit alpha-like isoform X2 n=1 Tax=Ruditapes philippinarum TaxID=129788 RepID=UPI00295A79AA|nr:cyclic nucleotide-gated channel rod photoreceptor subunit alpha-like isoform X2 [Ruditapes philippinarum]
MESNHVTENSTNNNSNAKPANMGKLSPSMHSAKDRWGKLKTTMTVTSQINNKKQRRLDRGDSFLRKFSTRNQAEHDTSDEYEDVSTSGFHHPKHKTLKSCVIHPSGGLMFYWLGVVTLTVLYNLWTCIAREAFREIQKGYMAMWFCLDGVSDCIYLCDIFVQFRTGYLQQGLMVYDSSKLCKNYLKDKCFIVDILSLLPLDFLQFYAGVHPMLRFPRFLKIYRCVRFMHMYESRTAYPNLLRVANLSHILFLGSHWFAAFYYLISEAEGFEGDWSYPKPVGHYAAVTRKYLASLYWSTLTLTTIGDLPPPDTNWQYVFVIVSYLIGVFIFATIVGQVGNVITNRNASRQEFERLLDGAKFYMQMHNVPPDLQKRVQRWYDYVWTRGRLNCNDINSLGLLPDKLKTELALHVNLGTLKKVTIFQKCRPEFLHDLMLKMRAYIFTPGDLICRRGEVAREMFIIADGVVEILGDNNTVLTQMSTGDFFGEIGILNLDGGINRRTADVRSVGYSELFVLSREDVLEALKDHPDAEEILTRYARVRLDDLMSQRSPTCQAKPSLSSSNNTYASIEQYANPAFVISESSADESDKDTLDGTPVSKPYLPIRNHLSRKSSPCILPIPTTLDDRSGRKFSAPPLDLPIEVPSFSNFRGLSGNTKEISVTLDRFKSQIMQRLDNMETSNKETQCRLQETLMLQEKMMKNMLKKMTCKDKLLGKDDVSSVRSDTNDNKCARRQESKANEFYLKPSQATCRSSSYLSASLPSASYHDNKSIPHTESDLSYSKSSEQADSTKYDTKQTSFKKHVRRIKKSHSLDSEKTKSASESGDVILNISELRTNTEQSEDVYVHNINKLSSSESEDEFMDYKVTHL